MLILHRRSGPSSVSDCALGNGSSVMGGTTRVKDKITYPIQRKVFFYLTVTIIGMPREITHIQTTTILKNKKQKTKQTKKNKKQKNNPECPSV